jgi:hypothetical protein
MPLEHIALQLVKLLLQLCLGRHSLHHLVFLENQLGAQPANLSLVTSVLLAA